MTSALLPTNVGSAQAWRRMIRALGRVGAWIVRLVLPPRCPACGAIVASDATLCVACWETMRPLSGGACVACSLPLEETLAPDASMDRLCGPCLLDPPAFNGAPAAVAYGVVPRTIVMRFKYGRRPGHARLLANAMGPALQGLLATSHAEGLQPLLVPVPLHRWRLWRRGYNQAGLIADRLARASGTEVRHDVVARVRATASMRGRGRAARARAVAGAFKVLDPAVLSGRHLIIVDDVHASGATLRAVAKALRRAGAPLVSAVTYARVVPDAPDETAVKMVPVD